MIMMYFLFRQGGFDANSTSYLRKIQRSTNEKDSESNRRIIFKQLLSLLLNTYIGINHCKVYNFLRHYKPQLYKWGSRGTGAQARTSSS